MKRQKRERDNLSHVRAEVDADDGLDPREFFKKESHTRGAGRKAQQLCAQVADTLQQVFGESADAALQSLTVAEVVPAPDASQLLVLTEPSVGGEDFDADEAANTLARAGGWLRAQRELTRIDRQLRPLLSYKGA